MQLRAACLSPYRSSLVKKKNHKIIVTVCWWSNQLISRHKQLRRSQNTIWITELYRAHLLLRVSWSQSSLIARRWKRLSALCSNKRSQHGLIAVKQRWLELASMIIIGGLNSLKSKLRLRRWSASWRGSLEVLTTLQQKIMKIHSRWCSRPTVLILTVKIMLVSSKSTLAQCMLGQVRKNWSLSHLMLLSKKSKKST